MNSQLVRIRERVINLSAIAHAEYDAIGGTLEIFFQILPSLVLCDEEADSFWELLQESVLDATPQQPQEMENAIAGVTR